jgi:hypothetical protein
MKRSANIWILLSLLLLAACSTKPAKPTAPEVILLEPPQAVRLTCPAPVLVPSQTNRDLIDNSLSRQTAYDTCNIYHTCLLDWLAAAAKVHAKKGTEVPMPLTCGQLIK